jgi:hypothetical protein
VLLDALLCRHMLQRYAATRDKALHSYFVTRFAQVPSTSHSRSSKFLKTSISHG